MIDKVLYYEIYKEFYNVNKFRELKSIVHHGNNRLNHINRVAKMSLYISTKLGLDFISCTRGAILHDFFTTSDISKNDTKYNSFLKNHPVLALKNAKKYFDINEKEENIILSHMYPLTKDKPLCSEAKVVCICDKIISVYEFFRYDLKFNAYLLSFFMSKQIKIKNFVNS